MAFQNRPQKAILLGWILPICLLVVLSNPVAGWDFSSLVSFSPRGLRGSPPPQQSQQDSFVDQQEEEEEDYFEDFVVEDFDAADAGAPQEEIDRQQKERELHPGHSHYGGYSRSYYGVPYRATNVYYSPYNPGYYGGYYRYYGYRNRNYGGYYNNQGYNSYTFNRPYNYNRAYFGGGFDDWLDDGPTRSNFWV